MTLALLKKTASVSFALAIIALKPLLAQASGLLVSPEALSVNLKEQSAETELVVSNPTANVQLFEVYPDAFEKNIKIYPASFTLESGERRTVKLTIAAFPQNPWQGKGILSANISVVAKPLTAVQVQVGAGVKIPLTATFSSAKPADNRSASALWGAALLIAAAAAGIYPHLKKRETKKRGS